MTFCHRGTIENRGLTDHDRLADDGDSRNMAAQTDSEQTRGERTLYRSSDGACAHWRGIHDENGRLTVAINFNTDLGDAHGYPSDYLHSSMSR